MKENTPSWPFCHPPWPPHSGSNKSGHPSHTTKKTRTHTRKKKPGHPRLPAQRTLPGAPRHTPIREECGERDRPGLGQSSATPAPNRFVDAFLVSAFGLVVYYFFCRYSETIQASGSPPARTESDLSGTPATSFLAALARHSGSQMADQRPTRARDPNKMKKNGMRPKKKEKTNKKKKGKFVVWSFCDFCHFEELRFCHEKKHPFEFYNGCRTFASTPARL